VLGAFLATLGVVLPSFFIILLIAALIRNFLKYRGVQAVLKGIRPCIVGLIMATAAIMLLSTLFGFRSIGGGVATDVIGVIIFAVLIVVSLLFKKVFHKKLSPIVMILISAGLGMMLYSI
jgi:chromate transporter